MIQVSTTRIDAYALIHDVEELAENVYRDPATGTVFISDGTTTVTITTSAE